GMEPLNHTSGTGSRVPTTSVEQGLGIGPILFRGRRRDPQDVSRLGDSTTEEKSEFDQFRLAGRFLRQAFECFLNGENFQWIGRTHGKIIGVCVLLTQSAAVLATLFTAGIVHEDAAHALGGSGKEMTARIPLRL